MSNYNPPEFSKALLAPKYWPIWLGFGLLALVVNLLPYPLLYKAGRGFGALGMKFGKNRAHVTKRNLELAFPDKTKLAIDELTRENFKNTGLALIETAIAWFWPDWRFERLIASQNTAALDKAEQQGKGVLLCCVHALNLEITARAFSVIGKQGYGIYRPHDNPAYNFIQHWGRTRTGNQLIDRKDLKGMIRVLRQGKRLWYLPDQDYGRRKSVFVPFFAVDNACTTTGTSILAYTSKCAIVTGSSFRNEQGRYELMVSDDIQPEYPQKDERAAAAFMNKQMERVILRAPEQWMWLHKRFKTMENPAEPKGSRYKL
jgi:KDO2-lipid IV(A) lauroyltransferase